MERYINDDELIYLMRCGSQEAQDILYKSYYRQVARWIRPYCYRCVEGWEFEDYLQFAMATFSGIIDSYRLDQKTSLKTFMKQSIIRRILSLRRMNKEESCPIYMTISLDSYIGDDRRMRYEEIIGDPIKRDYPDITLKVKEAEIIYNAQIHKKTSLHEREVMAYKKAGFDEKEIADRLDISIKSVYNAVYRYHKKVLAIDELK